MDRSAMKRPNWLGRFFLKQAGISWSDERFWSTWSPQGMMPSTQVSSEMRKEVGDGTGLDVIMSPALWIARRMAESPLGISKVDEEEIDFAHDLPMLMKWPNPWYAGSTMRLALAINYCMDGNAYLRKVRDTRDKVIALVFYPAWTIEPVIPVDAAAYNDGYQYNPGGINSGDKSKTKIIPARDIVHLRYGIDPNNTRKGISPLKILLREIYTDAQGSTMTAMILKNAGVPGAIISPREGVSIQKPTETKKYIEDEFSGVRLGKPLIMTAPTDVVFFGLDAAKMDLSKLRDIPEERVCALLSIPAAVVGFGTGIQQTKVGATLIELRHLAYEDCIIPTQNFWCDEFDLQLLPDFEEDPKKWHCRFDNSAVRVLQDDENKISERHRAELTSGGITLREFREAIGMEADESHEVYYVPSMVVITPADEINTPTPPPIVVSSPPSGQGAGEGDQDGQQQQDQQAGLSKPKRKQGLHGEARMTPKLARLQHRLMREELKARKAWEPELAKAFRAYAAKVAAKFLEVADRRGAKGKGGNGRKADPNWDQIGEEAIAMTWAKRDVAAIASSYGGQFIDIAEMTFESLNTQIGLGVMFTDNTQQMILKTAGRRLGLIDLEVETRDKMFEALAEARAEGLGADAMARRIEDLVSAGPWSSAETRARVIARTETKYAQNYSSLEAYRESETVTDALIFDAQLGPTDEECEALNGETVSLEEAMYLMETEHPNGTRSFAPVVSGEEKAQQAAPLVYLDMGGGKRTMRKTIKIRHSADGQTAVAEILEEPVEDRRKGGSDRVKKTLKITRGAQGESVAEVIMNKE